MPPKYRAPTVPRWYRFDWQYAVDVNRLPLLRPASAILSFMPFAVSLRTDVSRYWPSSLPLGLWLTWVAAVLFVVSWIVLGAWCPRFVKEYRDFGAYKKRDHSHRWIVWEFYNNLESFRTWRNIVQETIAKGLAEYHKVGTHGDCVVCDAFAAIDPRYETVLKPINVDRDICLPMRVGGSDVILWLREDDPKRDAKEKELFWILYSQAAKERRFWRVVYWCAVYTAGLLFLANVSRNIYLVLEAVDWFRIAAWVRA